MSRWGIQCHRIAKAKGEAQVQAEVGAQAQAPIVQHESLPPPKWCHTAQFQTDVGCWGPLMLQVWNFHAASICVSVILVCMPTLMNAQRAKHHVWMSLVKQGERRLKGGVIMHVHCLVLLSFVITHVECPHAAIWNTTIPHFPPSIPLTMSSSHFSIQATSHIVQHG